MPFASSALRPPSASRWNSWSSPGKLTARAWWSFLLWTGSCMNLDRVRLAWEHAPFTIRS